VPGFWPEKGLVGTVSIVKSAMKERCSLSQRIVQVLSLSVKLVLQHLEFRLLFVLWDSVEGASFSVGWRWGVVILDGGLLGLVTACLSGDDRSDGVN
jgi:hypothetical protein